MQTTKKKKLGDFSILSIDDKNSFSYGTPPMAAFNMWSILLGFGYYKFCLKTENNRVKAWNEKF